MSKKYLVYNPDQVLLMPPSLRDWLPANHLVYFIIDVVDQLDIRAITLGYEDNLRGAPPFSPHLMLRILFYAYCTGVYSSRQIARRLQEDVAFRILAANSQPDFRTIGKFRKRHQAAMADLFLEILKLCAAAGLVKCGKVALDGTKLQANASKHKAMSYARLVEEERRLQGEIDVMLKKAEQTDKAEDQEPAADLPAELAYREKRLAKIREAKAALEAAARERDGMSDQAQTAAESSQASAELDPALELTGATDGQITIGSAATSIDQPTDSEQQPDGDDEPPKGGKRRRKRQSGVPKDKAQRNFTDPDSRIMRGSDKQFLQGYNGQIAVDTESQVIVAADLTNQGADSPHALSMAAQVEQNTSRKVEALLADAGYFSDKNVTGLEALGIEAYVPSHKIRHCEWRQPPVPEPLPEDPSAKDRMKAKLQTPEGRKVYGLRKQTVEPVFGQIKGARGFRQLHLRGLQAAKAEWLLVCLTHNLLKLFRAKKAA